MLIALLAVLGVDLIVIVAFAASVFARRRWVKSRPGAFQGAIRVVDGQMPRFAAKWRRGYGRWVRDVLVWERGPFLFRGELVPVDGLSGPGRVAETGEVKRLGKHVDVVTLTVEGGARVEVAVMATERNRACGPFTAPSGPATTGEQMDD